MALTHGHHRDNLVPSRHTGPTVIHDSRKQNRKYPRSKKSEWERMDWIGRVGKCVGVGVDGWAKWEVSLRVSAWTLVGGLSELGWAGGGVRSYKCQCAYRCDRRG